MTGGTRSGKSSGGFGRLVWLIFVLTVIALPATILTKACGVASNVATSMLGQAGNVVSREFGPEKLFERYQWFKDAAAQCDKKLADLKVYEARFVDLADQYKGVPRGKWARDDREQWSIWRSEYAGVAASYNDLAASYNADMAKLNWRFCNVGALPEGATDPLPREFKPYVTK